MAHLKKHTRSEQVHQLTQETVSVDLYYYPSVLVTIETYYNPLGLPSRYTITLDFHERALIYFRSFDPVLYKTFFKDLILTHTDYDIEQLASKYNFI